MTILTDHHHLFLQAMLLRRTAPFKTWDTIFKKCRSLVEARDREQDFGNLIRDLNHRLEPLGFRITQTVDGGIGPIDESEQDQVSDETGGNIYPRQQGERWLGLINTKVDNSSKLATELTPAELNFFRRMISKIIRSPNQRYCITFFEAIRIHGKIQGMKKIDAQNVLDVLIKKGWLSHISGVYTLSIRAQLELDPYFEKTFEPEELPPKCFACRNTVMRGFQCSNVECRGALHVHCNATWKKTQTKCSECKGRWSNEIRIGQDAPDEPMSDTEEESDTEAKEEDEEEEEEGIQQTQTQTQVSKGKRRSTTSSQKTQKKSRNSRTALQDSDEEEEEEEEEDGLREEIERRRESLDKSLQSIGRPSIGSNLDSSGTSSSSSGEEDEGLWVALYDFVAEGEGEMGIYEGELDEDGKFVEKVLGFSNSNSSHDHADDLNEDGLDDLMGLCPQNYLARI